MFKLSYGKRPIVEESQIISAGNCVRNYIFDLKRTAIDKNFDLNHEEDVEDMLRDIESGTNFSLTREKNGEVEFTEPNNVKMTYTKSNLGKGFVFWFKCNICSRRVKYLYFPPSSQILACRKCHRLSYERQNENKRMRSFNKLFNL